MGKPLLFSSEKKNGKIRPCVDYRKLNAVTNQDAFPLPRAHDCLYSAASAKYFSTFDFTSGYHQIPMEESIIPKTALVTKYMGCTIFYRCHLSFHVHQKHSSNY
jgi:hypothetical protein